METILNILTLGLYSVLSKRRSLSSTTTKRKYRDDGTLRKEIVRDVEYDEGEGVTKLPE